MTSTVLRTAARRALSAFRLAKLSQEVKKAHPAVREIAAEFWHFIEADAKPDADGKRLLERLLRYGVPSGGDHAGDALFLVVPRLGTISPWSSKATDIARNCGLVGVRRIERESVFVFPQSKNPRERVSALIHNRMTESVPLAGGGGCLFSMSRSSALGPCRWDRWPRPTRLGWPGAMKSTYLRAATRSWASTRRTPNDHVAQPSLALATKIFNGRYRDARRRNSRFRDDPAYHPRSPGNRARLQPTRRIGDAVGSRFSPGLTGSTVSRNSSPTSPMRTYNHPTAMALVFLPARHGRGRETGRRCDRAGSKPKADLWAIPFPNLRVRMPPLEDDFGRPGRMFRRWRSGWSCRSRRGVQQRVCRPCLAGYFRPSSTRSAVPAAGPQAHHARGRRRQHIGATAPSSFDDQSPAEHSVAQLPSHGRRRGVLDGAGANNRRPDFDSVQRGNAESTPCRSIDRCWKFGEAIRSFASRWARAGLSERHAIACLCRRPRARLALRCVPS